ncbi:hypothetical protein, partial [Mesorhizobium sp. M7A.F.Ca.US.002.01.1.1]|uniref:hypothetical protein n=1 Tax=Mesorhizobium sp. M7A.F.Ca.US.002.01.1.1 TaxID=2496700 RepID=UPI0019D4BFAE
TPPPPYQAMSGSRRKISTPSLASNGDFPKFRPVLSDRWLVARPWAEVRHDGVDRRTGALE